jgi:hypothetical protein
VRRAGAGCPTPEDNRPTTDEPTATVDVVAADGTADDWQKRLAAQLAERQARRDAREQFRHELQAARDRGKAIGHARRLAHRSAGGGRR